MENAFNLVQVQRMVDSQAPESSQLDFKRDMYGDDDRGKLDFLKDVTAFANTAGGQILIGVEEKGKCASGLVGVKLDDFDLWSQRWDGFLADRVDPPLRGVEFAKVDLPDGSLVIRILIKRSWVGPHRIRHKHGDSFYMRVSSGNQPMETRDIRQAFLYSDSLAQRMEAFRRERLVRIAAGEPIVPVRFPAIAVNHLFLTEGFAGEVLDLSGLAGKPLPVYGLNRGLARFNFDGLLALSSEAKPSGYVQVFRQGVVEMVDSFGSYDRDCMVLPGWDWHTWSLQGFSYYLQLARHLGWHGEWFASISLVGVEGVQLEWSRQAFAPDPVAFDRNVVAPSPVGVSPEMDHGEILEALLPSFDQIWQGVAIRQSPYREISQYALPPFEAPR